MRAYLPMVPTGTRVQKCRLLQGVDIGMTNAPNTAGLARALRDLARQYDLTILAATTRVDDGHELTLRLVRTNCSGELLEIERDTGEVHLLPARFGA